MRYLLAVAILLVAGVAQAQCVNGVCKVRAKVRTVATVPITWVGQSVAPVVRTVAAAPVYAVRRVAAPVQYRSRTVYRSAPRFRLLPWRR